MQRRQLRRSCAASRIALEHWDRTNVAFQEQTFGRAEAIRRAARQARTSSIRSTSTPRTQDGNPVIPENSHVRLVHRLAATTARRILRRSYSYNDGANFTAERWPPWRQGMEYDAGLIFICYQRDLRNGFIKIFEKMSSST